MSVLDKTGAMVTATTYVDNNAGKLHPAFEGLIQNDQTQGAGQVPYGRPNLEEV